MDTLHRRSALVLALITALAGCKEATSVAEGIARVRVVNSVFQGDSAQNSVPVAVDLLIDSSMSGAGLSALAALSISPGSGSDAGAGAHGGTTNLFPAAGYRDLPSGVHSFIPRVSGTTDSTSDLFRSGGAGYVPKQFLLPYPYTFVLAGVVPPNGTAAPDDAVRWAMISDDPFPPPADPAGGYTARVQVINAAPMADPSRAVSDTTPDGQRIPGGQGADIAVTFDDGAGNSSTGTAPYRASSGFMNPPAGSYTLTLTTTLATSDTTSTTFTLYTGSVTLAKGEVRSFIVQSTAYAKVPGPGNTKVTNLLDNQW